MVEDVIKSLVEITLKSDEDFLKVRETLTRIGVASTRNKTLYQSCHILHKRQRFYIVHFKEMLALDGRSTNFDDGDKGRRNTIANLLEEWGLFDIVDPKQTDEPTCSLGMIRILPFKEKENWTLEPKYQIGRK